MTTPDALAVLKIPYYLSIIFGTIPVHMTIGSKDVQMRTSSLIIKTKYAIATIMWMTFISIFLITDINFMMQLNPTTFFSRKIIEEFPNDYYCIRLLHNTEIWAVLLITFIVLRQKLTKVIDDWHQYHVIHRTSESPEGWMRLHRKYRLLVIFYLAITVCPMLFDLFLLNQLASGINFQRILQGLLHCVPLTINLQFCSLCTILAHEFDNLNQFLQENRSPLRERVCKVDHSHAAICNLVRQVKEIYEVQLLLETCIITLNILLYTFHILKVGNHQLAGYNDVIYDLLWIGHFAGRLITTTMLASGLVTKARETSRLALLLEDAYCQISDGHEEILSLVTRVSNQDINFSICGFFILDGSLVISVCSWCVSFIFILLQFRTPT